jgi:hypothetical protein
MSLFLNSAPLWTVRQSEMKSSIKVSCFLCLYFKFKFSWGIVKRKCMETERPSCKYLQITFLSNVRGQLATLCQMFRSSGNHWLRRHLRRAAFFLWKICQKSLNIPCSCFQSVLKNHLRHLQEGCYTEMQSGNCCAIFSEKLKKLLTAQKSVIWSILFKPYKNC